MPLPYYHTGHAAELNARLRAREQRDVDIKRLWKRLIQTPQDFAGYPGPMYVPNCGCGPWRLAGTGADLAFGGNVWTAPGNIVATDGIFASSANTLGFSDFLVSGSHGFLLPLDLVITEIWATVVGYSASGVAQIIYETLTLNGTTPANGLALGSPAEATFPAIPLPTTNGPVVFGGLLSGTVSWQFTPPATLTPAQINTAGFGLMFVASGGTAPIYIDSVSLQVCGYFPPFPNNGPNN
ncbi:MAG: hypothetical protein KGL35_08490 [Bradyrhizobium sp.]|nr:hypothetical protein [Bradyrhizobium sp.]